METQYTYPKMKPVANRYRGQVNAQDIKTLAAKLQGDAFLLITPERWDAQGHGYCRFLHVNQVRENHYIQAELPYFCVKPEEIITTMWQMMEDGGWHNLAHEGRIHFKIEALETGTGFRVTAQFLRKWDWNKVN